MRPRMVILEGPGKGRSFDLHGDVTIGRDPGNAICIPAEPVSKWHCTVQRVGDTFFLEDQKSTNGTFVNGLPIGRRMLEDGDEIRLGKCHLLFLIKDAIQVEPSSPAVTVQDGLFETVTILELPRELIVYLDPAATL